jgi:hypothetical protein
MKKAARGRLRGSSFLIGRTDCEQGASHFVKRSGPTAPRIFAMAEARDFLRDWPLDNVYLPQSYENKINADGLARRCIADGRRRGVAKEALIQAAGGDILAYFQNVISHEADAHIKGSE